MNTLWRQGLKIVLISSFFCSFGITSWAEDETYFYVVKKSDVATLILFRSGLTPIYKKNGFLAQLRKFNPRTADLNQIRPGQRLYFSKKFIENGLARGLIEVKDDHEVAFVDPRSKQPETTKVESVQVPPAPIETAEQQSPLPPADLIETSEFKSFVSLAAGIDFFSFSQNGSETRNLEYSSLTGPSFAIRAGTERNSRIGVEASYVSYPGQLNSSTTALTNSRFSWASQSVEATYRVFVEPDAKAQYHFRLGVQRNDLPYVQIISASAADVRKHDVYAAVVGFDSTLRLTEKWRAQFTARYQFPFAQSKSGDAIDFQSQFALDGSVGASYELGKQFNLGLYWTGSRQDFNYTMFSEATGQTDSGKNSFVVSNFELRLGYEF